MERSIGKRINITQGSYFPIFRKKYVQGAPILFGLYTLDKQGQLKIADGTEYFTLFDLKIKHKDDLTRSDIEYDLLRTGVGSIKHQ